MGIGDGGCSVAWLTVPELRAVATVTGASDGGCSVAARARISVDASRRDSSVEVIFIFSE